MGVPEKDLLSKLNLPPGFRFYPTDEELLVQYLYRKVAGHYFSLQIIAEIDLYKYDPWILPSKAIFGEKEWYFFSPRDRKYPNGSRPNRVAGSGYWKATGTDKTITTEGRKVGIKKSLVFYIGKAPKGTKTNWIMHEYRLLHSSPNNPTTKVDEWVLCRIYKKNSSVEKSIGNVSTNESSSNSSSSNIDESHFLMSQQQNFTVVDWTNPAVMNSVTEFVNSGNQTMMNDLCVPTLMEEHVQSKTQQQEFFNTDSDGFRYGLGSVNEPGFGVFTFY
ncbi:hypothetical protein Lal_00023412 [Lupinus albus]|uniref:Putative transcription factor NAM family n=1 Tax=Lupinus albus TaxID=3870 RepID=A0A6A4NMW2_LUPAL|nr:putative transcription factor NAM family [Lupinus albus]KAF1881376.1 hypothetical protein Lal_00023412 [Lupinus albus]